MKAQGRWAVVALLGYCCSAGVPTTGSIPSTCADKKLSVGETDIDCGGHCLPCFKNQKCERASDCFSNKCNSQSRCSPCTDCTSHPIIRVLGEDPDTVELEKKSDGIVSYNDPGAVCIDPVEGNLNSRLGFDIPDIGYAGKHQVTYTCSNKIGNTAKAVRTVITKYSARAPPNLKLIGDKQVVMTVGEGFDDAGASCRDKVDGEIEPVPTIPVMSKPGSYFVVYSCKNSAGELAVPAIRTVIAKAYDEEDLPKFKAAPPPPKKVEPKTVPNPKYSSKKAKLKIDIAGPNPDYVQVERAGQAFAYNDPGAACQNLEDGSDLSKNMDVKVPSFSKPGTYYIKYSCESKGSLAVAQRKIVATAKPPTEPPTPPPSLPPTAAPTETPVEKQHPEISILGPNPYTVVARPGWSDYHDPGAVCITTTGAILPTDIDISAVNFGQAGKYSVLYRCSTADGEAAPPKSRTIVAVTEAPSAPKLVLAGPNPQHLLLRHKRMQYADPGVRCVDAKDGDITARVVAKPPNLVETGKHFTQYACANARGEQAVPLIRVVYAYSYDDLPLITLFGPTVQHVEVKKGARVVWDDPGAVCEDRNQGPSLPNPDVNAAVPDLAVVGKHVVTYTCRDETGLPALPKRRTVITTMEGQPLLQPKLTMRGPGTVKVFVNEKQEYFYEDKGAGCTDPIEGTLDENVIADISGIAKLGHHNVKYTCRNSLGNYSQPVYRLIITQPAHCDNKKKDVGEVNVDCGGKCEPCTAPPTPSPPPKPKLNLKPSASASASSRRQQLASRSHIQQLLRSSTLTDGSGSKSESEVTPILNVLGQNPAVVKVLHFQHFSYEDAGATCVNPVDGADLSSHITVRSPEFSKPGTYHIKYACKAPHSMVVAHADREVVAESVTQMQMVGKTLHVNAAFAPASSHANMGKTVAPASSWTNIGTAQKSTRTEVVFVDARIPDASASVVDKRALSAAVAFALRMAPALVKCDDASEWESSAVVRLNVEVGVQDAPAVMQAMGTAGFKKMVLAKLGSSRSTDYSKMSFSKPRVDKFGDILGSLVQPRADQPEQSGGHFFGSMLLLFICVGGYVLNARRNMNAYDLFGQPEYRFQQYDEIGRSKRNRSKILPGAISDEEI